MKRNGFGERLKELLKQKGLTQAQAATAVGTSIPSVNRWTKGGEIEYDNLRVLADFLDVNWVWLRYGDEAIESLQKAMPSNDAMTDMRREYLNQILDSEARMKAALEMAHIVNWEWNVLTGSLSLSDNAGQVFGCEAKVIESAMLPFANYQLEEILQLFKQKQPHSWDFSIQQNSDNKWFNCSARLVFDSLHRPVKVIGVCADITARKTAEQALERSEYMMRKIIDTVPVGLWAADETGTICLANPEVKRIWGGAKYVSLDQYGQYRGWWDTTGEELGPEGWSLARAVNNGESSQPELVNIEAFDGKHRTIIMYATPLYDSKNKIIGAIEINQDVTETQHSTRELKKHLEHWQSLFQQRLFDVVELDEDLKVAQLSTNLAEQYPSDTNLGVTDLFDEASSQALLNKLRSDSLSELYAFELIGKLKQRADAHKIFVITDNRDQTAPKVLIFCIALDA